MNLSDYVHCRTEKGENGVDVITPEQFKDAFVSIISEKRSEFVKAYGNADRGRELMFDDSDGILWHVASTLHVSYQRNYRTIDGIFHKPGSTAEGHEDPSSVKSILAGLRYEDDPTSVDGIINLSLLNVPLKVLITCRSKEIMKILDRYAQVLSRADIFEDFALSRKQMIIFSHVQDDRLFWLYFVYNGRNFDRLQVPNHH